MGEGTLVWKGTALVFDARTLQNQIICAQNEFSEVCDTKEVKLSDGKNIVRGKRYSDDTGRRRVLGNEFRAFIQCKKIKIENFK